MNYNKTFVIWVLKKCTQSDWIMGKYTLDNAVKYGYTHIPIAINTGPAWKTDNFYVFRYVRYEQNFNKMIKRNFDRSRLNHLIIDA